MKTRRIIATALATISLTAAFGISAPQDAHAGEGIWFGQTKASTNHGEGIWFGQGSAKKGTAYGEGIWF